MDALLQSLALLRRTFSLADDYGFERWALMTVLRVPVSYHSLPVLASASAFELTAGVTSALSKSPATATLANRGGKFTPTCSCERGKFSACEHMAAVLVDAAFCPLFQRALAGDPVTLHALNKSATDARADALDAIRAEQKITQWFSGGRVFVDAPLIASLDFSEEMFGDDILLLSLRKHGEKSRIDPKELGGLKLREPFESLVALADTHRGNRKSLAFTGATGAVVLHALREYPLELTKGGHPLTFDPRAARLALAVKERREPVVVFRPAKGSKPPATRALVIEWQLEDGTMLPGAPRSQWYFPGPNAMMVDVTRRKIFAAPGVDPVLVQRSTALDPLELPTDPNELEPFFARVRRHSREVGIAPPARALFGLRGAERPELTLNIDGKPLDVRATLRAKYSAGEFAVELVEPESAQGFRDLDVEREAFDRLRAMGFAWSEETHAFTASNNEAGRVWFEIVPALKREAGSESAITVNVAQGLEGAMLRRTVRTRAKVSFKNDWFELDARFTADDISVDRALLRDALAAKRRWIALDDGTLAEITDAVRDNSADLLEWLGNDGPAKLSRFSLGSIDRIADGAHVTLDEAASRVREQLRALSVAPTPKLPPNLQCTLRPYQEGGLAWLQFLDELGVGGVLADDMGLGKTLTALAYLSERRARQGAKPSLVVAPASVLTNWVRECQRFTPDLRATVLHGGQRSDTLAKSAEWDILVTSYAILRTDAALLASVDFRAVIFDEAQFLKNALSVSAESARSLRADTRLALTGTPVENHLGELWAILDLVNPGMLGTARAFDLRYARPIAEKDPAAIARLRSITRPFVLRRTKREVLRELPEKEEITRVVPMTAAQRALYNAMAAEVRKDVEQAVREKGAKASALNVLTALLRLRQVACDPMLVDVTQTGTSAKREAFMELVRDLVREGRRALVFSQFVSLLSLWREELDREGIRYAYLDGSTTNRDARVREFQEGDVPLFLLSLKAGGTGLNLTAADTVIHIDPWWNPAVEEQASDRAHRMGQTRRVTVYRLVSEGSVEEKIQKLKAQKREIAEAVVSEQTGALSGLSEDDVHMLLSESDSATVESELASERSASEAPVVATAKKRGRKAK